MRKTEFRSRSRRREKFLLMPAYISVRVSNRGTENDPAGLGENAAVKVFMEMIP